MTDEREHWGIIFRKNRIRSWRGRERTKPKQIITDQQTASQNSEQTNKASQWYNIAIEVEI